MSNKLKLKKESLDLLDKSFNTKQNVVKISKNETFEHVLGKFLLSWELITSGEDIVTEAIFANNSRADIFALKEGAAYEVRKSETFKYSAEKEGKYPVKIRFFEADKVIAFWMKKLGYVKEKQK